MGIKNRESLQTQQIWQKVDKCWCGKLLMTSKKIILGVCL